MPLMSLLILLLLMLMMMMTMMPAGWMNTPSPAHISLCCRLRGITGQVGGAAPESYASLLIGHEQQSVQAVCSDVCALVCRHPLRPLGLGRRCPMHWVSR